MTTPRPGDEIDHCEGAHRRLLDGLGGIEEGDLRAPSLLPGWTRAHVLSHLAGQADSVTRRLAAAAEGRLVDQYEGGSAARNRAIEAGARQGPAELVGTLARSIEQLEATLGAFPDDGWDRPVRSVDGPDRPAAGLVYLRWQETEIHHVDLDLAYGVGDWPAAFVTRLLPETLAGIAGHADGAELLGWLLDRRPAPALSPWD